MPVQRIPPGMFLPQEQFTGQVPPTIVSATKIYPSSVVNFISGTAQLETIVPPIPGVHQLVFIFTNVAPGQLLTSGNIGLGITPLQDSSVSLFYDPATKKYYPSASSGGSGAGNPASPNTSIQFNNGGSFGGSANLTWDNVNKLEKLTSGSGISFAGIANPITMVGGDDGGADTAIVYDNVTDAYITFKFNQYTDFYRSSAGMGFVNADYSVVDFFDDASFSIGQPLFTAQHAARVNETLSVGETVSAQSFDYNNVVTTIVSALEEPTIGVGVLNIQIGTGYSQTTQPTPRGWGQDLSVQGPINLQPHALNGTVEVLNNYYNGTAIDSPIGGHWIVTGQTFGGHLDATHLAATTYTNDLGLGITGVATGGGVGWTVGIQVGGSGSPWGETSSKIGTGIHIRDHQTNGILIDNGLSTAPAINHVGFIQGLEMTAPTAGATNTYRLFAQDNGGGKTQLMVIFNTGAAQQIAIQP